MTCLVTWNVAFQLGVIEQIYKKKGSQLIRRKFDML